MIELKNVNKSFGSKKVINNLDLVIPDGQILAIVGPSGGGKTTLLRTLAGLETADSGTFLLDEAPLIQLLRNNRSRSLAWFSKISNYFRI